MRSSGKARKPMCGAHEGPARLVATRGYSTTMAISTLQKLLAAQVCCGVAMVQSRRRRRGGRSGSSVPLAAAARV